MIRTKVLGLATVLTLISMASPLLATPSIAITEFDYKPGSGPGEWIELTNVAPNPVDVNGWSQDDSTGNQGVHPFGNYFNQNGGSIIQPGESFILTEGTDPNAFRSYWGLPSTVKVYAYGSQDNIGNGEGFFIYDTTGVEDSMPSYGGGAAGTSYNIPLADLGAPQNGSNLVFSSVGDIYGSYHGGGGTGDVGNPGIYAPAAVPEPSSLVLGALGVISCLGFVRKRIALAKQ